MEPTVSTRPSLDGIRNSATLRLLMIGLLSIVLLLPLAMVRGLLSERRQLRAVAAASIASGWAGRQTLTGPALVLRFACAGFDEKGRPRTWRRTTMVLPDRLDVRARATSELRRRGIHAVPVYQSEFEVAGEFTPKPLPDLVVDCPDATLLQADLALALSDPRGIERLDQVDWAGTALPWQSGTGLDGSWSSGVSARLPREQLASLITARARFSFELDLRGSDRLSMAPAAGTTNFELTGDWPSPSFDGAFLPRQREVGASGFHAAWTVSSLARPVPAVSTCEPPPALDGWSFGVTWFVAADGYLMVERSLKHGFLFVLLTFLLFYLFELGGEARLHPVQYGLVGGALCVFYLLLLSLCEQYGVGIAYSAAATASTIQITLYARAILGARKRALVLGAALVLLYAGLYALIGAEELALLIGSVLLFAALGALMWRTRAVDWSRQRLRPDAT